MSSTQNTTSDPANRPHAALIIIGHGSTVNPDSSAPTLDHAERIRRAGNFGEVACAFWKEEPSMREVFTMLESNLIYIVPNFISEGYFTREVLPRELELDGPVSRRDDRTLCYCDPVGIHPTMTRLLLQRADELAPGIDRGQCALIIVGHGTSLNDQSTLAIKDQVRRIKDGNHGFADVIDAYMEEAPLIAEWDHLTTAEHVLVVPFFIADGLHSYQDIPVLLGMETEPTAAASERGVVRHEPRRLRDRWLHYSAAIGTEPDMADVILDQVGEFDRQHAEALAAAPDRGNEDALDEALLKWLDQGCHGIGQIHISRSDDCFRLCHEDDVEEMNRAELEAHHGPDAARHLALHDDQGAYRPLKTAPTLKHGWELQVANARELRLALDAFYPAAVGMWLRESQNRLHTVPLRTTLKRQTGMYKFSGNISHEGAIEMVRSNCRHDKCLRKVRWDIEPGEGNPALDAEDTDPATPPWGRESGRIPLLCMEICCHVVDAARKIARDEFNRSQKSGESAS